MAQLSVVTTIIMLTSGVTLSLMGLVIGSSRGQDEDINSNLFWSYYNKATVDRSHVITAGYQRDNPVAGYWDIEDEVVEEDIRNEIDYEDRSSKDDILVLGSLFKISHGPRRRREADHIRSNTKLNTSSFRVYEYPGSAMSTRRKEVKPGDQLQQFRDFLGSWPLKSGQKIYHLKSNTYRHKTQPKRYQSRTDYNAIYDEHNTKFHRSQNSPVQRFTVPHCRHACEGGDPSVPCCSDSSDLVSLGPFVQPGLAENWFTGLLEVVANTANSPAAFIIINAFLIVGVTALVTVMVSTLGAGMMTSPGPGARYIVEEEFRESERILMEVVTGNWLTSLEDHVRTRPELSRLSHYYCCVFTEEETEAEMLECFPHKSKAIRTEPAFTCDSDLKYDISLNLKNLDSLTSNSL